MKSLLIQMGTQEYEPLLRWSRVRHAGYCRSRGLDYEEVYELPVSAGERSHRSWGKVVLIREALALEYDLVIWLDADAVLVRPEIDVREALPVGESAFIGMVENRNGHDPHHYNAGAIWTRNGQDSRDFWQYVWEHPVEHPFHEQQVINSRLQETNFRGLRILPPHWNCVETVNPVPDPIIRAWHGLGDVGQRLAQMQEAVGQ